MKILWEYELPFKEEPSHHDYEGPLFVHDKYVYFANERYEYPREERANDELKRNILLDVHKIDIKSGMGEFQTFKVRNCLLPSKWNFIQNNEELIFHSGNFHSITRSDQDLTRYPYGEKRGIKGVSRGLFLKIDKNVIFANITDNRLYCFDLSTHNKEWELDLTNTKRYEIGPPKILDDNLVCYGRDSINYIDPSNGTIKKSLKFPRIDLLYPPNIDNDDLIFGYSNWTMGGVFRYSTLTKKSLWRYRKKSQDISKYCELKRYEDVIIWVKGGTEIIGIDVHTGQEIWSLRTKPWLYTDIDLIDGNLIYGTSGKDGYIQSVNALTGKINWLVFLKNGCAYFNYYKNSIVVGDSDRIVQRINFSDGKQIDEIQVNGEIIGDILVSNNYIYTVVWFSNEKPPRIICIEI